ncbi:cortactin binding protein N-terminal like nausicaa isoform X1 [Colletes latitarsis]|uniref:cortactin binding protein N-terminal like nausicaa isoform X1 n=1 Tax=Colletes latitarsis TaxID=2605962 RepID=UPI004036AE42
MASQSQNATNVSTTVSPANGSSGSSTTISVCTTKMQSFVSTPSSQPYQQQHSSPSSSPSPSPMQQQQQQHQLTLQQPNNVEALDKNSSNTLKRNPKMELSKSDLLKLLGHLEGELQARDIVIAVLKSEKLKHLLSSRYLSGTSDPHAALARDVALVGGVMRHEPRQIDQQVASLEALVTQQRRMQSRMTKVLKEAELRHRAVIKELEEEKRKHEHDTAQGDDITYGLEKERTRLKKELELEKQEKKRLELEIKKANDTLEEEKTRQKQVVLLLLAERKKIIMKYIEERKRSEDLAQILSEEKVRIDSMAEGLEEESKKSLQMEAELEKQLAQFDMERQQYRQALAKEEKRVKDLELELDKLRNEMDVLKESQTRGSPRGVGTTPPPPPVKPANLVAMPTVRPASAPQTIKGTVLGTGTPMVSSKVVQPTATVSSVPVSGPTTGIARSVTPGQALRGVTYASNITSTSGETVTSETQAVDKRVVVPAPVNPGGAVKLIPPTQTTGKLGFHVGSGSVVQASGMLHSKKPPISRGVPPPVPPNKPVVPPKKEAAYLRRTDSSQSTQDAVKLGKQTAVHPASGSTAPQVQQAIAAFTQASDEENHRNKKRQISEQKTMIEKRCESTTKRARN